MPAPPIAAALVLGLGALAGCSPTPEPSPSPTAAFASEEEAYAAAEETYRAYIAAVNAERAGDDAIDPHSFLTGKVLEAEIRSADELETAGTHIEGVTVVSSFLGTATDLASPVAVVRAQVCLDITDARAINGDGIDVTVDGRSDIYGVDVTLTGSSSALLISEYEIATDAEC